jgi:eukaryotic-like serine/threonine-protein kinase
MALVAGTRLGPYEIVAPLGAGGMGEVYSARDTRLNRTVAIKVLLQQFSADPELKQRFEREARAISSLQHPHICTLHDVGEHEGVSFLVMELLEGETLAARLQRGPMSMAEIVKVASQVAEALDRAHRHGIVHRDLKPGNVMLAKDGAKLMDFGLAKPLAMGSVSHPSKSSQGGAPLLSAAVTMSSPSPQMSPLTSAGTIVGTIQYMSPEQIEGREADARSDIFALGAVMYEMATGKRAFQGKSQITVASAILEKDPEPISAVQATVPLAFERIVQTCLAKDPEERFQTAHDVKLQLRWAAEPSPVAATVPAVAAPRSWKWQTFAAVVVLIVAALAGGYWLAGQHQHEQSMRVQFAPPEKTMFDATGDYGGVPVLSPNGEYVAFSAHNANSPKGLWVRPLNSYVAQHLEGTDGAAHPFWSPDGRYLGFFANGKLLKVLATGGPVVTLADAENPRGGSWCGGDVILFAPNFQGPLMRVNANGGQATAATNVDAAKHTTHRWPWCLPDGKHFLYLATSHQGGKAEENGVYFGSLSDKSSHLVVPSDAGGSYASGYLLYHAQTSVMAQAFDPSSGKVSGDAVAILDKVKFDSGVWRMLFTVSDNGLLAYMPGGASAIGTQLVWCDRTGKVLKVVGEHSSYSDPRLSPDGKRLAFVSGDPIWDVWTLDLERGTKSRVTFDQTVKAAPAWSTDGKTLAFGVTKTGSAGTFGTIHTKPANGTGTDQTLAAENGWGLLFPEYSPDGRYLVYRRGQGGRGSVIYAKPLQSGGVPIPVIKAEDPKVNLNAFRLSPNGRWIAYESNESGATEIYVAPFPHGEGKWQVSNGGGLFPLWRGDSREIYYETGGDEVFAVGVEEKNGELQIGTSQSLFRTNASAIGVPWDVDRSGQRFLINRGEEEAPTALNLVTNWTSELKKK